MGEEQQDDHIQQGKLYLSWDKPWEIIAPILEPVINQQQCSPPAAITLGGFILVHEPNRSWPKSRADLPKNDDNDEVKRVEPQQFLGKKW